MSDARFPPLQFGGEPVKTYHVKVYFALTVSAAVLCFGGGCASVPKASSTEDLQAKTFQTKPGVANLYVYREPGLLLGAAVGWDVNLDGRTLGLLTIGTYIFSEVQPGQHTLSRLQTVKPIRLEAGRNYFFRLAPSLAASETKFVEVPETKGRTAVTKLSRVVTLY
ncbi:MAG: DUF2846 domain-containing protein [Verrucomicrobia bacterium]|nr:DUF2846 domain-containing protein [Verrucomicrobiota bacterium]